MGSDDELAVDEAATPPVPPVAAAEDAVNERGAPAPLTRPSSMASSLNDAFVDLHVAADSLGVEEQLKAVRARLRSNSSRAFGRLAPEIFRGMERFQGKQQEVARAHAAVECDTPLRAETAYADVEQLNAVLRQREDAYALVVHRLVDLDVELQAVVDIAERGKLDDNSVVPSAEGADGSGAAQTEDQDNSDDEDVAPFADFHGS